MYGWPMYVCPGGAKKDGGSTGYVGRWGGPPYCG